MFLMRTHAIVLRLVLLMAIAAPLHAQEHQHPPGQAPDDHGQHHGHDAAVMSIFPAREASGTAWLPDVTPMHGYHRQTRGWDVMLHGNAFVQFIHESGEEHRTSRQAGSINWVMGMARRPFAGGRLGLRGMLSLEPWTIPGCGYPVLLATGETCAGDTIHDRQHPHDLFMEIASEYDRPLSGSVRWGLYGGFAGEPALGPVAFPHRPSAMPNPIALIGHHWLDATHITFGVVTAGVYGARWKTEASVFNGREPDENRADFDLAALSSYSGRIWFLPAPTVSLQLSAGHLDEAEADPGLPRHDVDRVTASASYHRRLRGSGLLAATVAWGMNRELVATSNSALLETSITADGLNTWFARGEVTGKTAHSLHVHEAPLTTVYTVGKLQAGYVRYLRARRGLQPGIGGSVSASLLPADLQPRYGGAVVPGVGVFLAFRPAAHE
jgi:hypothetical protein